MRWEARPLIEWYLGDLELVISDQGLMRRVLSESTRCRCAPPELRSSRNDRRKGENAPPGAAAGSFAFSGAFGERTLLELYCFLKAWLPNVKE